jgi:protein-tyrosine-phosphatase
MTTHQGLSHDVCGRLYNRDTWTLCRELALGLVGYGWARIKYSVETALERRRMNSIRRHPVALMAALRSARRILIVCHGNIIRSPFAACMVAQAVASRSCVSISSAGLGAVAGMRPHPTAVQIAAALSVDLSNHAASPVSAQAVAASDAIFVMEADHLVTLRNRFPEARAKTFLLTCLAAQTPLEIRDPFASDEADFRLCFDHISRAVHPIVSVLSDAPSR